MLNPFGRGITQVQSILEIGKSNIASAFYLPSSRTSYAMLQLYLMNYWAKLGLDNASSHHRLSTNN
jgi:hypothetical protein